MDLLQLAFKSYDRQRFENLLPIYEYSYLTFLNDIRDLSAYI